MTASSEGLTLCSREFARGGEGLRWFCGAKKGGSTITTAASSSPKSWASPVAMRPPNECPTTTGGPASYAPASRPASRASRTNWRKSYAARQSERPMPLKDGATTRRSPAKNGAMKLHQSPWAAPPCRKIRPGLPRSPQARVSTCAPSTATNVRSGSIATTAFEPRRRRRLLPAKGRERRHGGRFGHGERS